MMNPIIACPSRHYTTFFCDEAKQKLSEAGFVIRGNDTGRKLTPEEQKKLISDAFAIVAGTEIYDADMLDVAKNLKTIIRYGVGLDNFDLEAMRERGISVGVINNCNAVAEFALTLILDVMKSVSVYDRSVRGVNWPRFPMHELSGKTVGIVGFGRIGQRLAKLMCGFDVTLLAYDPFLNTQAAEALHVRQATFSELLAQSDVISLHLPASKDKAHVIGRKEIAAIKDGAFLVNTARGSLVDEQAVQEALNSGKLSGYAADVFESEPVSSECVLLKQKNTVLTPHTAALTYETNYNAGIICADSIIRVYNGGTPLYQVK